MNVDTSTVQIQTSSNKGNPKMDYYKYAEMIGEQGITSDILADVIRDHRPIAERAYKRYLRYEQDDSIMPVWTNRKYEGSMGNKINNHIENDYFGEIIDTKAGYLFGQPMGVTYAEENEVVEKAIRNFNLDNNIDDLNADICTVAGATGYDALLMYNDTNGRERLIRIDPWEAIVLSKTNMTEPEYGIIYYKNWKDEYIAEFYDEEGKRIFKSVSGYSDFIEDETLFVPNVFGMCQLVGVPNNTQLQGDAEKVLSLIDGFDNAFSNAFDEIDQFREAYILMIGHEPTKEIIDEMKKTGALYIPESGDGQDIKWLIKNLDPTYLDAVLNRAEANITRFASHVNFTDAAFGGDITGPAMRYKLFALETKTKKFERKHEAVMRYIYRMLGQSLALKGVSFDYRKIEILYNRNIPANLLDEAQTALALRNLTSLETALSTLSVVGNDVQAELERIDAEKEKYSEEIDLDEVIEETKEETEVTE